MPDLQYLRLLSRKLADEGKLIEAGWISMRIACVPPNASAVQLDEMRLAFMAGAQHLFGSLLTILDPCADPTEADMRRMGLVDDELTAFGEELKLRLQTKGSA